MPWSEEDRRGQTVEELDEKPEEEQGKKSKYRVLYDGQCEICQSCVSLPD